MWPLGEQERLGRIEGECRDDNGDKIGYKVKFYGKEDKLHMLSKESVKHSFVSSFDGVVMRLKERAAKHLGPLCEQASSACSAATLPVVRAAVGGVGQARAAIGGVGH